MELSMSTLKNSERMSLGIVFLGFFFDFNLFVEIVGLLEKQQQN
jgi:hypothetical protein